MVVLFRIKLDVSYKQSFYRLVYHVAKRAQLHKLNNEINRRWRSLGEGKKFGSSSSIMNIIGIKYYKKKGNIK